MTRQTRVIQSRCKIFMMRLLAASRQLQHDVLLAANALYRAAGAGSLSADNEYRSLTD